MSGFGFISSPWKGFGNTGTYYSGNTGVANNYTSAPTFTGSDLATTCPQCGVYLIDGTSSGSTIYPINCSFYNLSYISANSKDDGFIVYPNFGIQVFTSANFSGTASKLSYNTYNFPLFFSTSGTVSFSSANTFLLDNNGNQWSTAVGDNKVVSIRVYYQGTEIIINPFNVNNS